MSEPVITVGIVSWLLEERLIKTLGHVKVQQMQRLMAEEKFEEDLGALFE